MATTVLDKAGCGCNDASNGSGDGMLPASPFTALQYHFGMLLGVDDLETAQAYPRGKIRLHNAWLHREGVVWGFGVSFNTRNELTVAPGLALDAAGHELHLDATACVDLGKWYEKHKDDPDFATAFTDDGAGGKTFKAYVVARFRACLARPVPAISDPCAGSEVDTAFSRISETVELLLRPGDSPKRDLGYHRLRILFALEDDAPAYAEVQTRREWILTQSSDIQPREYLKAFREFAALDEIDLTPQHDAGGATSSLFPEDPTEVVLADVGTIDVRPGAAGGVATGFAIVAPIPVPNVRVRRSHVATATIQELLCGPLFSAVAAGAPPPAPTEPPTTPPPPAPTDNPPPAPTDNPPPAPTAPPADAGGPRIESTSVKITSRRRIAFTTSKPVDAKSVRPEQFSITTYTSEDGWSSLDISDSRPDAAGTSVVIDLKESVTAGQLIRLVARGTGPQPILGTDLVPLAGAVGGPAGSVDDGHDFAIMLRRS
ncbi:MAG: hypothetical protein M3081_22740 [Gemmatimonadota bacterium]|nr:hypothetical protein [Gemmatimonadota bacterium]